MYDFWVFCQSCVILNIPYHSSERVVWLSVGALLARMAVHWLCQCSFGWVVCWLVGYWHACCQ